MKKLSAVAAVALFALAALAETPPSSPCPACSTALSASKVYMYSFGQPTDGGPKCGLNTPILNCTTIINPP